MKTAPITPAESYPLKWPLGQPRTEQPEDAAFRTSAAQATNNLLDELRLLKASNIVITSNLRTRRGPGGVEIPYVKQTEYEADKGVAVYWTADGEEFVYAIDRWRAFHDNVQAVALSIAAIRGLSRWGGVGVMKAAFSGFLALPGAGEATSTEWAFAALRVSTTATEAEIKSAHAAEYKRLQNDAQLTDAERHAALVYINDARKVALGK